MLPTITQIVTDMLDGAHEQHHLLADARPCSLDNTTLDHVERVYRDGIDGHEAFENQIIRWQRDHPGAEGLAEPADQVSQLRPAYQRVLDLARQQRANTIEALILWKRPPLSRTPRAHRASASHRRVATANALTSLSSPHSPG